MHVIAFIIVLCSYKQLLYVDIIFSHNLWPLKLYIEDESQPLNYDYVKERVPKPHQTVAKASQMSDELYENLDR